MKEPIRISETLTNITVRFHEGLKPIHYRQAKKKSADLETWRTVVMTGQSRNFICYKNEAYGVVRDVSNLFQVRRLEFIVLFIGILNIQLKQDFKRHSI